LHSGQGPGSGIPPSLLLLLNFLLCLEDIHDVEISNDVVAMALPRRMPPIPTKAWHGLFLTNPKHKAKKGSRDEDRKKDIIFIITRIWFLCQFNAFNERLKK